MSTLDFTIILRLPSLLYIVDFLLSLWKFYIVIRVGRTEQGLAVLVFWWGFLFGFFFALEKFRVQLWEKKYESAQAGDLVQI